MNELIKHIETLLLENDCVVIPNFGGFIAYYSHARWSREEMLFLPPMRTIGFNPNLTMNDGLLVQSYMNSFDTDFSDASKLLDEHAAELISQLHKEGRIEFGQIGEFSLSIDNTYSFEPFQAKLPSPTLYGFNPFEIKEISQLEAVDTAPSATAPSRRRYISPVSRVIFRNCVAAAAVILLFFALSTPVQNTYVESSNYAQILPADLLSKLTESSLLTSSVVDNSDMDAQGDGVAPAAPTLPEVAKKQSDETVSHVEAEAQQRAALTSITTKEVHVPQPTAAKGSAKEDTNQPYHIIVASVQNEEEAQKCIGTLHQKGYINASVLKSGERIRVSIASYADQGEAYSYLNSLRKDASYKDAWLFTRK